MATSKSQGHSKTKRNTDAPGQALGYSLQFTLLTNLLLRAPEGSLCCLEVYDDVAQEDNKGNIKLIQSKSALTSNPVSDRAKPLWKTFSNWIEFIVSSKFDIQKMSFNLYVSRPVSGEIVKSFSDANTPESARRAIENAQIQLWGTCPDFNLKSKVATEIKLYLEKFFMADQRLLEILIVNFHLIEGSGSPQADIESLIRSHPVSVAKVEDIANYLCGFVKRTVDKLLEEGKPAIIARDDFHKVYSSYVQKIDRQTLLISRANAPSDDFYQTCFPKNFILQMEIIDLTYEYKLKAVSDYFMSVFDRTDWAARGEVDETSFDDLDKTLMRTWENKNLLCQISFDKKSEQDKGKILYSDCMQFTTTLQTMLTPDYFIPGCFHLLADNLEIGWHPDYVKQLNLKKAE